MVVCHCHAVSDNVIRAAVEAGIDDERALAEHCGAGTRCGGCRPELQRLCSAAERMLAGAAR